MECSEVLALLSEAALGDLDAGPARELADHVRGCEACRSAEERTGRTLRALRGAPGVAPSVGRREAVVRAMSRERGTGGSRWTWIRWAAASAVFVGAMGAVFGVRSDRGFEFRVASVSGRVALLERSTGLWRAVSAGEVVHPGDRLVTEIGGMALLDLGTGTLHVDPESSLDFVSRRKLMLDRGRLSLEVRGSQDLAVSDTANNTLTVRAGRAEIGLYEAKGGAGVGGSQETKGQPARIPEPRMEVGRRLVARILEGEADLDGSLRQRLHVVSGQEGRFTFGGQPSTLEAENR